MTVAIIGAGAFGTALAIALTREDGAESVTLWTRDAAVADAARTSRQVPRLSGIALPDAVTVSDDLPAAARADILLLAVPAQALGGFVRAHAAVLAPRALIACCKGIDLETGLGPVATIRALLPGTTAAILTGPSFAVDIARGLPTALTLACADDDWGRRLQSGLSTPLLRLYRSGDTLGAELGGALKNVMAIACGVCIGAGFGDSARAALMTRGFAEMQRIAARLGALPETLSGLSGFGDLVLTCTSENSRNYRYGLALGTGAAFDPSITVEGVATARALADLAGREGLDAPISTVVAAMVQGRIDAGEAMQRLLSRPLKEE